jgi:uncharacterized protein (TIGR02145 family)
MNAFTMLKRGLLLSAALTVGTHTAYAQQQQNYTGNGGKGISLTVYVPQSTGLAKEQSYIPALVQGEFVSNFSNYSAISVLDWERLDDIYVKLTDEAYDDKADAKQDVVLGRLAPTSHFLTGNITKTAIGYNIKINITATVDKMTTAAYSGTFTFAELDNLTGVRRASLELLQKVGVELTEKARLELAGAAESNQILAQTALAKGITAQRQGTSVAALSYYYQAASFNPALNEAVKRSSVTAANISSGNIGADLRNDILWRKKWMATLKETEETVHNMINNNAANPPYTLIYYTKIKTEKVNYQTETADLSITMRMKSNQEWFTALEQALKAADYTTQAVLDGLNSTNRKNDWGLARWPRDGVSNTNPFVSTSRKRYDIRLAFELVNQQGMVIGKDAFRLADIGFNIERKDNQFTNIEIIGNYYYDVNFKGVKTNDISDNLTIRVASVNGEPPQKARFTIKVGDFVDNKEVEQMKKDAEVRFEKISTYFTDSRNGYKYRAVKIGDKVWMAENLNHKTGNSWCYESKDSDCKQYGRLYDWNTAKTVCPVGWHLPSRAEWNDMVLAVGGGNVAGKKLKSTYGWTDDGNGTDEYGFSTLPGGYRSPAGSFYDAWNYGYWWTVTERDSEYAYLRLMLYDDDNVNEASLSKGNGFSVRCVSNDYMPTTPTTVNSKLEPAYPQNDGGGKTYKTVIVGGKTWMAENLNIKTGDSWCYDNKESNCDKYGRLYNWNTAKRVCPVGWHLPTFAEWRSLVDIAGGDLEKLKAKTGWKNNVQGKSGNGTDTYGFSALPGGYRDNIDFNTAGYLGFWWTDTENGANSAYTLYMMANNSLIYAKQSLYKSNYFSVRCVQDN